MALKFASPTGFLVSSGQTPTTSGSLSMVTWINMSSSTGAGIIQLYDNTNTGGGANCMYLEYNGAFNKLSASAAYHGTFGSTAASGGVNPTINAWHGIGGSWFNNGGTTQATVYVDGGNKITSGVCPGPIPGINSIVIGNFGSSTPPSGFFPGSIGLCAVWNTTLSDAELFALTTPGVAPNPWDVRPESLVAVYDPNLAGGIIQNLVNAGAVPLTVNGSPTLVTGAPVNLPRAQTFQVLTPNQIVTASDFSLSGGSSIVPGGTTSNITITPNGVVGTANCTFSFSDGGAGGTFTPSTQTINNGSGGSVAFQYMAASGATPGTVTITVTTGGTSSIPNGTQHTIGIIVDIAAISFTTSASRTSIITGGTSTITYMLNNPAPHGGVNITPTLSGSPGGSCSPSPIAIAELGTSGTTIYTAGGTNGTEIIGGSSTLTQASTVSIGVSSSPLAAGTLSAGSATFGNIALSSTAPTGGVPPYNMQLFRTETNLPASSLNIQSLGSNAVRAGLSVTPAIWGTSQTVSDNTVRPSKTYYYQAQYTDAVGSQVLSNQVSQSALTMVIGFIGDSITLGAHSTMGTGTIGNTTAGALGGSVGQCQRFLQNLVSSGTVTVSNQGINGTRTMDWANGAPGGTGQYPAAKTTMQGVGVNVMSIMLGTNDATTNGSNITGQPQTPTGVKANLLQIINQVKTDFPGAPIIIHCPPWLNGARGTANGLTGYGSTTIDSLRGYLAAYYSVVDNVTVFLGDIHAINVFNSTNEGSTSANGLLADGVHPNDAGYQLLGTLWGLAIARVVFPRSAFPTVPQIGGIV